jgi:hypothetical protein
MIAWQKRHALGLLLLLLLAASLTGCFDYEVNLALARSGEGQLRIRLTLPEHLTAGYHVSQLDTIVFPEPERVMSREGGLLTISETCAFTHLDELAVHRIIFEVKEVGTGILGMGDYTYRVVIKMEIAEEDLPDRDVLPGTELERRESEAVFQDEYEARARQLTAQGLAGHYVSMALRFPGLVDVARPLILGSARIDPEVSPDGAQVCWRIPLAVLVSENVRNTLVFSCDFKGYMEFRAYMQEDARSHYSAYFDEGLAAGKDMGDCTKAAPRKSGR